MKEFLTAYDITAIIKYFYSLLVYPREQMEPLIGAKVTVVTKDVGNGKIFAHWTIDKCPEMNSVGIFKEGVENHMDMPMFGGKVKITYKKSGNGYETVADNEKYGKFEFKEVYDETGYNLVSKMVDWP